MPSDSLENIPQDGIRIPVEGINTLFSRNQMASTILFGPDFFEYNIFFTKRIYFKDIEEIDVGLPITIFFPRITNLSGNNNTLEIRVRSFFPNRVFLSFNENVLKLLIPFLNSKGIKFSPKALELFSRFING